jgi:hypothetical protein
MAPKYKIEVAVEILSLKIQEHMQCIMSYFSSYINTNMSTSDPLRKERARLVYRGLIKTILESTHPIQEAIWSLDWWNNQ